MTQVLISLTVPSTDGSRQPASGSVRCTPSKRLEAGADVVLPVPTAVSLDNDGRVTVELTPTSTDWCWRVTEMMPSGIVRYVSVPDTTEPVDYATLTDVDPATLQPTDDSVPAWTDAVSKVQAAQTAASVSEHNASVSAQSASDDAAGTAHDRQAASTSAASASVSETNAAQSAQSAAASAASIGDQLTQAQTAAADASSSKVSASQSAQASAKSAQAAATSQETAQDNATTAVSAARQVTSAATSAQQAAESARDMAQDYRDQAETFAGSTVALQDQAVSSLLLDPSSKTNDAVRYGGRKTMVVFGDSMTVSASATAKNWEYLVGAELGLTVRNYGVGGMGFITGTTPYMAQLANARNDTSYNHARDVRYVMVNGSTNDIYNNLDDMTTAINSFAAAVKQEYPNAEYIGISGLCGANVRWTDRDNNHRMQEAWPTFATTAATLLANGFHVIGGAEFWLLYNFDATQSDGLHPNDAGHRLIANNVLSELAGIHPSPYTAGYKPSSRTSFTADKLTLPVVSATNDYYVWKPDPMNRQYSISGNAVIVTLNADQTRRFGINTTKDANGNLTGIYGIDVPIAKKLFPVTRLSVHQLMDSMPNSSIYINNTLLQGGQPNYLTYRKTDSRLNNPGDANEFLYARIGSTMIPTSDYSKPYYYNLLGQSSITVRADFSATFPVLGRFVG